MAASRMQFDFRFGPAGKAPRDDDETMHMLVLADMGGARAMPLAQRKLLVVDIDTFEGLFGRLAPSLTIELDGLPIELRFESMEDFHPDRLYARLAPFESLRHLRGELEDPKQFRRAAAALGLTVPTAPKRPTVADTTNAAEDIERLLGLRPSPPPAIEAWLRDLVAPHIQSMPNVEYEQRQLLAAADGTITSLMRRVLHEPRLQALEASWRGVERLVRELELDGPLRLRLLDVSRAEIADDIAAHQADLTASAMHRHICSNAGTLLDGGRWGLLVLDQAFGPEAEDVQQLATLGAMAARAGAPLLAAATPQVVGCAETAQLAEPRSWPRADDSALAHWTALRTSPMAPWLGLVLPRVLMRLPYGAATDSIASFEFEEMPTPREHAAYLWGRGPLALALLAGLAFQQEGWSMDLGSQVDLVDLPSHAYIDEDGDKQQQPCAELLLSEQAGEALADRGLMPLMSWRNRDAIRLLRWQSLADPPRALQGLSA